MGEALLGLALIIVAVFSWSLAPSLISRLSRRDASFNPLAFNAWRMVFAALATLPLAAATGFPYTVPWLNPLFQLGVVAGGVVSTVVGDTAFVYAVSRIGASAATPIAYMFVVWSSIVDVVLGYAPAVVIAAALVSMAGVWLIAGGRGAGNLVGVAAALLASLVWTMGNYGYKIAMEIAVPGLGLAAASIQVGLVRALYTAAALAPFTLRWRPRGQGWAETIGASLAGYVVGALAYIAALGILPVSVVSIGLAMNPAVIQLVAWIVAGEKPRSRVIAGALLVTAGIIMAYTLA